ncbi:protein WVD2-like 7 [Bidens hawaiensis]|uniref:protein WVD2-like 7 n=1 Tax=Bidens hawaiensis TaxID=980011 RepID=UPI00404A88AC
MAGEIEEPLRFNFQADLLHSGSISFGRFESESLSWERRSSFSHNRYLEEVEKYSKPGTVTEKKAYFEAHFRRKALLKQSSSESKDERELPASENDDLHDLQESENGNDSKHFTCFDESPHSSGHFSYNKETEVEICVNPNIESLRVDQTVSDPDHYKLEETHQTETANVNLVQSEEITEVTLYDSVVTVDVVSETKHPKPKPNAQTNITQVSRIISSEASNVTSKTKTREIKGSPKVKKSTRPASAISYSGRKTSKSEESSTSFPKAKLPPPNKSIVKESRPEKSLQRARETINRTKPTVIPPSKPHANQTATGFNFKSDQRAEWRKEEKRAAAETTQSRKNLNFKATPMPSFYKESVRSLDHNKVTSSSKTPNRPRTASMAPSAKKVPSNYASLTNPRPSSSTSVTNRSRLPEPSRKVQDKKKDLNLPKQKQHEAIIGSRARETKGVHTGYLPVRVAT